MSFSLEQKKLVEEMAHKYCTVKGLVREKAVWINLMRIKENFEDQKTIEDLINFAVPRDFENPIYERNLYALDELLDQLLAISGPKERSG